MVSYIYDGTFEGLVTLLAGTANNSEEIKEVSSGGEIQPDLFTEVRVVETDPALAGHFFKRLTAEFSRAIMTDIVYCFLSEEAGIEKTIIDFIRLLFTNGEKAAGNFKDGKVFKIRRASDRVAHEILRFQGFVRFRKLPNDIFYAPIEPDHNVIQFLAPHFKTRFADQRWLIHDTKRKTGIFYDGLHCLFLPLVEMSPAVASAILPYTPDLDQAAFDPEEIDYQELWDQYFQHIAIIERQNKKVQRQRMPVRYWRYLVENVMETKN